MIRMDTLCGNRCLEERGHSVHIELMEIWEGLRLAERLGEWSRVTLTHALATNNDQCRDCFAIVLFVVACCR